MDALHIFEQGTRDKVRFAYKGQLSIEDLWDLRAEALDQIHIDLNGQLKAATQESLLAKPNKANDELVLKIAIVRRIFEVKQAEAEERKQAAEKLALKRRILEIKAKKQDEALEGKSEAELDEMLAKL